LHVHKFRREINLALPVISGGREMSISSML